MKKALDTLGKAVVTGYSSVYHTRASDVLNNLEEEARGIRWHEGREDEESKTYFELYDRCYTQWQKIVNDLLERNQK